MSIRSAKSKVIPYGRQDISDADIAAVARVLRSDYLTQGPEVVAFERAVADRVGAAHAVAVNSATSALHLACMAFDMGPGKLLWTSPNTFVASANCARYCGADVDFVDIDPATLNMSTSLLAERLHRARRVGRLPDIVVPVHFSGRPTDQEEIFELSREFGFAVVEDASHAIGASRRGEPVGSCRWSDISIFSFHPVKIVTSAEGGMLMTNSEQLAERLATLRSHGITRDPAVLTNANEGAWYYEQHWLGYNYRLTDIQAALGLSQLDRLDEFIARRIELVNRYDELLRNLPVTRPLIRDGEVSAWHLYAIQIEGGESPRRAVFDAFRAAGVFVQVHYIPVHLQPYYRHLGFNPQDFPASEAYYAGALSIPLYPAMTNEDQDRVVEILTAALRQIQEPK